MVRDTGGAQPLVPLEEPSISSRTASRTAQISRRRTAPTSMGTHVPGGGAVHSITSRHPVLSVRLNPRSCAPGSGAAPKTVQMIDSTVIRAHHQAAPAKGGLNAVTCPAC
jgi:hypothetical protein